MSLTPGPWTAVEGERHDDQDECYFEVVGPLVSEPGRKYEVVVAQRMSREDATMAASSLELLESLKAFVETVDSRIALAGGVLFKKDSIAMERGRAAIATAEGKR